MADEEEQSRTTPPPPSSGVGRPTLSSSPASPSKPATPYATVEKTSSDTVQVGASESAEAVVSPRTDYRLDAEGGAYGVKGMPARLEHLRALAAFNPVEVMLRDPLGDVARKERRSLLGISAIAILVGWTGLVPARIENFGISFAAPERKALLWVFIAVVVYYLYAFIVYSVSDYLLHRYAIHLARLELSKRLQPGSINIDSTPPADSDWQPIRFVGPTSRNRTFFDFIIPLLVGLLAISSLGFGVSQVKTVPKAVTAPASSR